MVHFQLQRFSAIYTVCFFHQASNYTVIGNFKQCTIRNIDGCADEWFVQLSVLSQGFVINFFLVHQYSHRKLFETQGLYSVTFVMQKTNNSYKKYFFIKLTFIQFYSSLKYTHYIKMFGRNSLQLPCKSETPVHESQQKHGHFELVHMAMYLKKRGIKHMLFYLYFDCMYSIVL